MQSNVEPIVTQHIIVTSTNRCWNDPVVSHPQFKLRWVPPAERESLHVAFVQCLNAESSSVTAEVAVPALSDDDDYGYNETASDVTQCGIVETEASSYLADPDRSLGMLHKYLLVRSAFIHFNTMIPSSAPVERLLALADKLRQQDAIGCQTPTLKNFCLKLIPVMFEMLNMWIVVFDLTE